MARHHPDLIMCMKQPGVGECWNQVGPAVPRPLSFLPSLSFSFAGPRLAVRPSAAIYSC